MKIQEQQVNNNKSIYIPNPYMNKKLTNYIPNNIANLKTDQDFNKNVSNIINDQISIDGKASILNSIANEIISSATLQINDKKTRLNFIFKKINSIDWLRNKFKTKIIYLVYCIVINKTSNVELTDFQGTFNYIKNNEDMGNLLAMAYVFDPKNGIFALNKYIDSEKFFTNKKSLSQPSKTSRKAYIDFLISNKYFDIDFFIKNSKSELELSKSESELKKIYFNFDPDFKNLFKKEFEEELIKNAVSTLKTFTRQINYMNSINKLNLTEDQFNKLDLTEDQFNKLDLTKDQFNKLNLNKNRFNLLNPNKYRFNKLNISIINEILKLDLMHSFDILFIAMAQEISPENNKILVTLATELINNELDINKNKEKAITTFLSKLSYNELYKLYNKINANKKTILNELFANAVLIKEHETKFNESIYLNKIESTNNQNGILVRNFITDINNSINDIHDTVAKFKQPTNPSGNYTNEIDNFIGIKERLTNFFSQIFDPKRDIDDIKRDLDKNGKKLITDLETAIKNNALITDEQINKEERKPLNKISGFYKAIKFKLEDLTKSSYIFTPIIAFNSENSTFTTDLNKELTTLLNKISKINNGIENYGANLLFLKAPLTEIEQSIQSQIECLKNGDINNINIETLRAKINDFCVILDNAFINPNSSKAMRESLGSIFKHIVFPNIESNRLIEWNRDKIKHTETWLKNKIDLLENKMADLKKSIAKDQIRLSKSRHDLEKEIYEQGKKTLPNIYNTAKKNSKELSIEEISTDKKANKESNIGEISTDKKANKESNIGEISTDKKSLINEAQTLTESANLKKSQFLLKSTNSSSGSKKSLNDILADTNTLNNFVQDTLPLYVRSYNEDTTYALTELMNKFNFSNTAIKNLAAENLTAINKWINFLEKYKVKHNGLDSLKKIVATSIIDIKPEQTYDEQLNTFNILKLMLINVQQTVRSANMQAEFINMKFPDSDIAKQYSDNLQNAVKIINSNYFNYLIDTDVNNLNLLASINFAKDSLTKIYELTKISHDLDTKLNESIKNLQDLINNELIKQLFKECGVPLHMIEQDPNISNKIQSLALNTDNKCILNVLNNILNIYSPSTKYDDKTLSTYIDKYIRDTTRLSTNSVNFNQIWNKPSNDNIKTDIPALLKNVYLEGGNKTILANRAILADYNINISESISYSKFIKSTSTTTTPPSTATTKTELDVVQEILIFKLQDMYNKLTNDSTTSVGIYIDKLNRLSSELELIISGHASATSLLLYDMLGECYFKLVNKINNASEKDKIKQRAIYYNEVWQAKLSKLYNDKLTDANTIINPYLKLKEQIMPFSVTKDDYDALCTHREKSNKFIEENNNDYLINKLNPAILNSSNILSLTDLSLADNENELLNIKLIKLKKQKELKELISTKMMDIKKIKENATLLLDHLIISEKVPNKNIDIMDQNNLQFLNKILNINTLPTDKISKDELNKDEEIANYFEKIAKNNKDCLFDKINTIYDLHKNIHKLYNTGDNSIELIYLEIKLALQNIIYLKQFSDTDTTIKNYIQDILHWLPIRKSEINKNYIYGSALNILEKLYTKL